VEPVVGVAAEDVVVLLVGGAGPGIGRVGAVGAVEVVGDDQRDCGETRVVGGGDRGECGEGAVDGGVGARLAGGGIDADVGELGHRVDVAGVEIGVGGVAGLLHLRAVAGEVFDVAAEAQAGV